MTGAVLDRPAGLFDAASGAEAAARGRVTLEELLSGALDEAHTNGSTECPVCHASMTSSRGAAECGACGSRLS
jgi:DnaJ-class molecular chaperone